MSIKEAYTPIVVGVNATVKVTGLQVGGFLAKTAGTITVKNRRGVTIVDAVPVQAGVYVPLPFLLRGGNDSATMVDSEFTTAGGASGTLGY